MSKDYKKMTPEQVQGLLQMRKRGSVAKNKKAYNRKQKHKGKEGEQPSFYFCRFATQRGEAIFGNCAPCTKIKAKTCAKLSVKIFL